MGKLDPSSPAPAYEDLYHNQPGNHPPPSSSAFTARHTPVGSTVDGDEEEAFLHEHDPLSQPQDHHPVSNMGSHTHCETCDKRWTDERRRRQDTEQCKMVAYTFMGLFVCTTIVVVAAIVH